MYVFGRISHANKNALGQLGGLMNTPCNSMRAMRSLNQSFLTLGSLIMGLGSIKAIKWGILERPNSIILMAILALITKTEVT